MATKQQEAEALLRGSTGLRDDFDGVISAMKFGFDTDYNDGKTLLAIFEITVDGGDDVERLLLSVGNGWEPSDRNGKKVQREKGENKAFNNSTAYAIFTQHALDAGADEVLISRVAGGTMTWDSELWTGGLRFHFNQVPYTVTYGDKKGEESSRLVPTEYLGMGDEKVKSSKAPKSDEEKQAKKDKKKAKAAEGE